MYKNLPTIAVSAAALVLTGVLFSVNTSTGSGYIAPASTSSALAPTESETPVPLSDPVEVAPVIEEGEVPAAPPQPAPMGILTMTTSSLGVNVGYAPAPGEDCTVESIANYAITADGPTGSSIGYLSNSDGSCSFVSYSADGRYMACHGYSEIVWDLTVNGTVTQSQRYVTQFAATGCDDWNDY